MKTAFLLLLTGLILSGCEYDLPPDRSSHSLPVISLSIDEKYLWSPDSGLYIIGENGITRPGNSVVANYNNDWEFPLRIRLYNNDVIQFDEWAGFRIKGNSSRSNSMKSFGIYWRSKYGYKDLDYKLFPDSDVTEYERLLLRNSGNDFGKTHIRDASISRIFSEHAHVGYQEYQPCVVYLNDEYWGIYNMREMITAHHFEHHYQGVKKEEVDLIDGNEIWPETNEGVFYVPWAEFRDIVTENDLSESVNYQVVCEQMDVESYMDYIIIQTYISNTDWPGYNVKWWRDLSISEHRKWKWVVFDTDFGFLPENVEKIWIGNLYYNFKVESQERGFLIFNCLIKNPEFREKFLDRYMYFIEHVFAKQRVRQIILDTRDGIADEYPSHQQKWNTLPKRKWEKEIDRMIEFNNRRNDIMREVIKELKDE